MTVSGCCRHNDFGSSTDWTQLYSDSQIGCMPGLYGHPTMEGWEHPDARPLPQTQRRRPHVGVVRPAPIGNIIRWMLVRGRA
ncbi:MAG: hypothetical protein D8M59_05340 [Planctomycetes bacterium]|nr:hypothetical protein [Planctomycetota bacterium]